jgi:hypothetical protein
MIPITTCSCLQSQVISSCNVIKNGLTVTFNMTKNNGGYCDLQSNVGAVSPIALLDEINYSPNNGFEDEESLINLVATPSISDANWNTILKTAVLQPSLNRDISLNNTVSNEKGFLFTVSQKTTVLPTLTPIGNGDIHKELDFNLVDSGEIYSIGKPFLLYSTEF